MNEDMSIYIIKDKINKYTTMKYGDTIYDIPIPPPKLLREQWLKITQRNGNILDI